MKNIFIFLLFLVSALAEAKGQQVYFNKKIDVNGSYDMSENILTANGGYIIAGGAYDSTGSYLRILLMKLDLQGNELWRKTYGKPSAHYFHGSAASFIPTNDGNYAMAGSVLRFGYRSYGLLMKFNTNGDTIWSRTYNNDSTVIFYQCAQTSDNGFILHGYTDINEYWGDFLLIKTDSLGNEEWRRTYGGNIWECGNSVVQTFDGGYLMGGFIQYSGSYDMRVIKTDANGNQSWVRTYGSQYDEGPVMVQQLSDGNYIFCGRYSTTGPTQSPRGRPYIVKLDMNGNTIWSKMYGWEQENMLFSIRELNNGDLVACGTVIDTTRKGVILRINGQGDSLWLRTYTHPNASTHYLYDIIPTSDKGFIATGIAHPPQDLWVLKVDSLGCTYPGCDPTAAVEEITPGTYSLRNYPNPFDDRTVIEATVPANAATAELLVYDVMGKMIKKAALQNGVNTISIAGDDLEAGIFFYSLIVNGERLATNKMVYLTK